MITHDNTTELQYIQDNKALFSVINDILPRILKIALVAVTGGIWLYILKNPEVIMLKQVLVELVFVQLASSVIPSTWIEDHKFLMLSGISLVAYLVFKVSGF